MGPHKSQQSPAERTDAEVEVALRPNRVRRSDSTVYARQLDGPTLCRQLRVLVPMPQIGDDVLLVAVTERRSRVEIEGFVSAMGEVLAG